MNRAVTLRTLVFTGLAAGGLWLIFQVFLWQETRRERSVISEQGDAVVALLCETIERGFSAVQSDLGFLATEELSVRVSAGEQERYDELVRQLMAFMAAKPMYDQIRMIDIDGKETVRINLVGDSPRTVPATNLQDKSDRYYVQRARDLAFGEYYLSQFDLNQERGQIQRPFKPVIRFVTPVATPEQQPPTHSFVLNLLGERLLTEFAAISRQYPGNCYLVNANGEFLYSPVDDEAWGWILDHDRSFRNRYPEAWSQLEAGRVSQAQPDAPVKTRDNRVTWKRLFPTWAKLEDTWPTEHSGMLYVVAVVTDDRIHQQTAGLARQLFWYWLGALPFLGALAWLIAQARVTQHQHAQERDRHEEALRLLTGKLMAAQEEERKKIARDLHDDFGQQISALIIDLEATAAQLAKANVTGNPLARPVAEARGLLRKMHAIVHDLRPLELDDLLFTDALAALVAEYTARFPVTVTFQASAMVPDGTPLTIRENAYRVVQEALNNCVRHAAATNAHVRLSMSGNTMRIEVEDDGRGFAAGSGSEGFGLLGMRERADMIGARLDIISRPDSGTRIVLEAPLPPD